MPKKSKEEKIATVLARSYCDWFVWKLNHNVYKITSYNTMSKRNWWAPSYSCVYKSTSIQTDDCSRQGCRQEFLVFSGASSNYISIAAWFCIDKHDVGSLHSLRPSGFHVFMSGAVDVTITTAEDAAVGLRTKNARLSSVRASLNALCSMIYGSANPYDKQAFHETQ